MAPMGESPPDPAGNRALDAGKTPGSAAQARPPVHPALVTTANDSCTCPLFVVLDSTKTRPPICAWREPRTHFTAGVNPFVLLAPLFFAFELWQLYVGERYLGIKQIRVNADPRELPMPNWMAALWSGGLVAYGLWMLSLLLHPVGRAQGVVLLAITFLGYLLRSATSLKWTLVILTFEGAIRIGMLLSLLGLTWRQLIR